MGSGKLKTVVTEVKNFVTGKPTSSSLSSGTTKVTKNKNTADALDPFGTEKKYKQSESNIANDYAKREAQEVAKTSKITETSTGGSSAGTVTTKTGSASTNNLTKTSSGYGANVAKSAIKTTGAVGAILGATALLSNSPLSSLFSDESTEGALNPEDTDNGNLMDESFMEEQAQDEGARSVWETIKDSFGDGGGTADASGGSWFGDEGYAVASDALGTIEQYLPWVLGGLLVVFLVSSSKNNTKSKAKAGAVKA